MCADGGGLTVNVILYRVIAINYEANTIDMMPEKKNGRTCGAETLTKGLFEAIADECRAQSVKSLHDDAYDRMIETRGLTRSQFECRLASRYEHFKRSPTVEDLPIALPARDKSIPSVVFQFTKYALGARSPNNG